MFSRRRQLDRRRKYSKELFESLVQKLHEAHFDNISIVLPHNYESVDPKNSIVDVQDFLRRERNYAAIIVIAKSIENNETLKILFVNSTGKALFVDDTFPSAASEPPSIYFQSPDPARAFGVFEFFYDFLSQGSLTRFAIFSVVQLLSLFVILFEAIGFAAKHKLVLSNQLNIPIIWDIIFILISLIALFKFFSQPSGLWIKQKRELKILSLIKMAIKGEFRDNPIIQLIITIISGLILAVIIKIFKLF